MVKKKRAPSRTRKTELTSKSVSADVVDDDDGDGEMLDSDLVLDEDFEEDLTESKVGNAAAKRLAVKRRLDAYLERKWFREHGWDDEDALFKDDFFEELGERKAGSK